MWPTSTTFPGRGEALRFGERGGMMRGDAVGETLRLSALAGDTDPSPVFLFTLCVHWQKRRRFNQ
jgi:hypothetical protein